MINNKYVRLVEVV